MDQDTFESILLVLVGALFGALLTAPTAILWYKRRQQKKADQDSRYFFMFALPRSGEELAEMCKQRLTDYLRLDETVDVNLTITKVTASNQPMLIRISPYATISPEEALGAAAHIANLIRNKVMVQQRGDHTPTFIRPRS